MEIKYYTLYLDKHVNKSNPLEFRSFKFIQPKFKMWNSESLYIQPKSGIIKCKSAYYPDKLRTVPIIVRPDEKGLFDPVTETIVKITGPVKVSSKEIPSNEVLEIVGSLNVDALSKTGYELALKELQSILTSYVVFCDEYKKLASAENIDYGVSGTMFDSTDKEGRQRGRK